MWQNCKVFTIDTIHPIIFHLAKIYIINSLAEVPRMKKNIYLILKDDLVYYPPVLSIINVCIQLGYHIVFIGNYSDGIQKKHLEEKGVLFKSTIKMNEYGPMMKKLFEKLRFRKQVYRYLNRLEISENAYVWLFHSETLCLLYRLVDHYRVIFHPLEFTEATANWKYRILSPSLNLAAIVRKSAKVVCCEYNRAQLTRGIYALDKMPYVLPNKMYIQKEEEADIPVDIREHITPILSKLKGKKIILYQGVFLNKERRLEEFCEAVKVLPDDYMLVAMGKGSEYYESLKKRYASDKILFIPFIRPPYHLLITKEASIGVLSYFPDSSNMASVINPLYCAPNKIFEYTRYGIPMISNDIPGLFYTFMQYHCGEVIKSPMTPEAIRRVIEKIQANYAEYSLGAKRYYESVDLEQLIAEILVEE